MKSSTLLVSGLAGANALNLAGLVGQSFNSGGLLGNIVEWLESNHQPPQEIANDNGIVPARPNVDNAEFLRLYEFGPSEWEWLDEMQMLEAKRAGRNFFDVTDHIDKYLNPTFATRAKVVYPSSVEFEKDVKHLAKNITADNMRSDLVEFSSFHTRYYKSDYGLESSLWLRDQIAAIAADRDDITVELFDHSWKQKSIIAHIEGSENPDHIVVVGAHQDSINLLFPSVLAAPGADDDGSGTVTILEIFRVLVRNGFKPKNSVEFQWYSAEEGGLLGSQDIFNAYSEDGKDVKAMLQQDMTGYNKGSVDENGEDSLGLITDYVDDSLTDYMKVVVDAYCSIPYVETSCGYGCSDHASASKAGYPSAFIIESGFKQSDPYVHTTMDTIDRLSFPHMVEHAKLTLGYAYELGNHNF